MSLYFTDRSGIDVTALINSTLSLIFTFTRPRWTDTLQFTFVVIFIFRNSGFLIVPNLFIFILQIWCLKGNLVDWQNVVYDATSSLPLGKLAELYDENSEQSKMVESAIFTRCPHPATAVKIANRIKKVFCGGSRLKSTVTKAA